MIKSKMESKSCIGLVIAGVQSRVFACAILCLTIPLYSARAIEMCGDASNRWLTIGVMGGEYRIHNNIWGSDPGSQCLTVYPNSTYFSVTTSTHNTPDYVQSYPFILRGRHFGGSNTAGSGLPILVSDVVTAPFIWSVDPNGAGGKWNIAYESWFSTTPARNPPDGAEIMIWLDWNGGMVPGGSYQTTVSIGGADWAIYHASPWSSWQHYIVYKRTTPTNYVNLDLKDFIDDSVSRGWIDTSWYMDNMEAGFELMVDGEGLTSNSFSGLVNEVFSTDFVDFADFAGEWGRSDCDGANNWCGGADHPPEDGKVDFDDLESFVNDWLR